MIPPLTRWTISTTYPRISVYPSTDFRFTHEANHGLGKVFIYILGHGPSLAGMAYPTDHAKFSRMMAEQQVQETLRISSVTTMARTGSSSCSCQSNLPASLLRLNQSIEAFVYCVLVAQVNVRSSILGDGGRAKEAQSEFLTLLEGAIRQPSQGSS